MDYIVEQLKQRSHAVRRRRVSLLGLLVLCCGLWLAGAGYATAASLGQLPAANEQAAAIEGDWLVQSRDAIIRIERVGDHFEGRIVWQLHDTYGPEDGIELNGKVVTDRKNPDPSLRSRPLTGLTLLWGLRYDPDTRKWSDGRVYDADNGHTYHCQVKLLATDKLSLRGYIGVSLLGGSTTWSRVDSASTMLGKAP